MRSLVPARVAAAVLVVVALLAGCSAPSSGERTTVRAAATPVPAAADAVPSWTGEDLLPAAGGMTRVGSIGVYYAADLFRYTLVAIDVTTGTELWRQPVALQGRVRGVVQVPEVDPAGAVFANTGDRDTPSVSAFDLATGAPRWVRQQLWAVSGPQLCGAASVCVQQADDTIDVRARTDGALVATGRTLGNVLGRSGELIVSGDVDRRLVELGRLGDGGYERVWRRGYDELFDDAATVSSDGGWSV